MINLQIKIAKYIQRKLLIFELIFFGALFLILFILFFRWTTLPFYRDSVDFLISGSYEIASTNNLFAYLNITDYPHTPITLALIALIFKLPINHIVWIHVLSIVFSLFFLIVMYYMGKTLVNPLVGVVLSLSFLSNPLFIAQTQMVYFEIIGTALRYLAIVLLLRKRYNWFLFISALAILTMIDNGIFLVLAVFCYAILENSIKKVVWLLKYFTPLIALVLGWLAVHKLKVGWAIYRPERFFNEDFALSITNAASYAFLGQGRWIVSIILCILIVLLIFIYRQKNIVDLKIKIVSIVVLSVVSLPQFLEIGKLGYFLERYIFPVLPVYYLGVFGLIGYYWPKNIFWTIAIFILITTSQLNNTYSCRAPSLDDCSLLFSLLQEKKNMAKYIKQIPDDSSILVSEIDNADLTRSFTGLVDKPLNANSTLNRFEPEYIYITPISDPDIINLSRYKPYIPIYSKSIPGSSGNVGLYKRIKS